ncbi:HAAS signaling domain-containing protein [Streptomyces vastus]|uniref:Membrane protein n=1 Tax=Streptomyces vastus TaxID=285451 RepID=A0ABP6DXV0_9ACTN
MGIESDKLVFDYLSRVGDLAQSRQLPSGTRMRLVTELRGEIDRRRSKATDSPASVRRILARLGTPEEVVAAAGTGSGESEGGGRESNAAVPVQRAEEAEERSKGLRRLVPRPRSAEPSAAGDVPTISGDVPSPPHLASTEELGSGQPDWWRVDRSPFGLTDSVPGFTGGVEIPELLKPPPPDTEDTKDTKDTEGTDKAAPKKLVKEPVPVEAAEPAETAGTAKKRRRFLPSARTRPHTGGGLPSPLLLLAAALLVAGAVIGNLVVLALGWLIAYLSRRLTPAESKFVVLGVPGLVAAAGITWLWGRTAGRWGDPIAKGQMSDAIAETWPWVLKGAAVASAIYLVWRSQRQRS